MLAIVRSRRRVAQLSPSLGRLRPYSLSLGASSALVGLADWCRHADSHNAATGALHRRDRQCNSGPGHRADLFASTPRAMQDLSLPLTHLRYSQQLLCESALDSLHTLLISCPQASPTERAKHVCTYAYACTTQCTVRTHQLAPLRALQHSPYRGIHSC